MQVRHLPFLILCMLFSNSFQLFADNPFTSTLPLLKSESTVLMPCAYSGIYSPESFTQSTFISDARINSQGNEITLFYREPTGNNFSQTLQVDDQGAVVSQSSVRSYRTSLDYSQDFLSHYFDTGFGSTYILRKISSIAGTETFSRTYTINNTNPISSLRPFETENFIVAAGNVISNNNTALGILITDLDGNEIAQRIPTATLGGQAFIKKVVEIPSGGFLLDYENLIDRTGRTIKINNNAAVVFRDEGEGDFVTANYDLIGLAKNNSGYYSAADGGSNNYAYLRKSNLNTGAIIWERNLRDVISETPSFQWIRGVVPTPDGGAVVGYQYRSTVGNGESFVVVRYNSDGSVSWTRDIEVGPATVFPINSYNVANGTADGGYFLQRYTPGEGMEITRYNNAGFQLPECSGGGDDDECNVSITSSNGGVTITGLTSDANTKLFDANTQAVWSCNPWQGNPCSGNESVPGLISGATYFLSVQSDNCEEWIPVTIQGGGGTCSDLDNDGICDADDCKPSNPSFPDTPGTPCNDFNTNTTNDSITPDGCSCEGTPIPGLCAVSFTKGTSGIFISGLTSDANVKLFDSNIQAVFSCNPWQGNQCATDGQEIRGLTQGETYFLSVQSENCNEWIPIELDGVSGTSPDLSTNSLTIGTGAPGTVLPFTFNLVNEGEAISGNYAITSYISTDATLSTNDIQEGNIITGNTPIGSASVNGAITVPDLPAGNYFLLLLVDGDSTVPESNELNNLSSVSFTITGGSCPDSDNDGVCNDEDCQPNNPNRPATPGSSCNDGNANTTNDQIQSDGCTCAGTPVGGGCNVNITSSNGSVTITGLTSDANTKLFNSNTQEIWGCNPWQGSPCSGNETVSGLNVNETIFLSVQSSSCNEWIPIKVEGDLPVLNGPDLITNGFSIGTGTPGNVLNFSFNLFNQGNSTANGSYQIKTYISADRNLSSDDIQEGTIATGNTPVGAVTVNGAITVPNLAPGTYYFFLVVDDGNNIIESNENNNINSTILVISNGGGPVGCDNPNVAQGKPTSQSSTITAGGVTGSSSKAVDGDTNGNFFSGSVAATTNQNQAWWQVDLGGFFSVSSIEVFNRTEGSSRLSDFYILTADQPFTSDNLGTARNQANSERFYSGQAGTPTTWNHAGVDALVRYVRIQRAGQGHVTLAEVRVNGCPPGALPENTFYEFAGQNEVTIPNFKVNDLYPNPTSGEIFGQIESTVGGTIEVQVVNILGQVKLERKIELEAGKKTVQLQLDEFDNGIYNAIFFDGNNLITKQFVIAK